MVVIPGNGQHITAVTFGGLEASYFMYKGSYRAVAGVDYFKSPGVYNMRVKFSNAPDFVRPVAVLKKSFPVVNLPVPEKMNETPEQLVSNLQAVNAGVAKITSARTPGVYFSSDFGLPLADNSRIGSVYGEIRKTGNEIIHHYGTDFTAKTGTAVGAINAGVVSASYYDDTYGNTVIVDHGQGIFSSYLHLSKRTVSVGDNLKKGALIGLVGETGLATAPHLHLSIKINGLSVDPLRFVRAFTF